MLYSLYIKNLALIDEEEITFADGLNILTGETGAGKSVVIGSITLALGDAAKGNVIREGAEYALITLTFSNLNEQTLQKIREMELAVEPDDSVILERRITKSRSVAKVGGETVSLKQMRELAKELIQIHGQNDHQSLLQKKEQAKLLDAYASEALSEVLARMQESYAAYKEALRVLSECDIDDATRKREADLAQYELDEINEASLVTGEDTTLEERYRKMSNAEKITEALALAKALSVSEGGETASDMVVRALKELNAVRAFDETASSIADSLVDVDALLQEISHTASRAMEEDAYDPAQFMQVTERLNLINRLKDKYGGTIEKILSYKEEKEEQLSRLNDLDNALRVAKERVEKTRKEALSSAHAVHEVRSAYAKKLSEQMREVLSELNFLENGFEVRVVAEEEAISANGFDDVEFFISLNPGEPLKPLTQVASGGELSRIMLALKTLLADRTESQTMIFDEVDAGISGVTAWKVAERLGALSKDRQLICITHLAQIAAMADTHFFIDKEVVRTDENARTFSRIRMIEEEERVKELARILGDTGDENAKVSRAAYENALRLCEEAKRLKG